MRTIGLLLPVWLLLLFSGCSIRGVNLSDQSMTVNVSPQSRYQITPPAGQWLAQGMLTLVKGRHNDDEYELLVQVELHADSIVMVGTTVSGLSLFELRWQPGKAIELQQSLLATDIQVIYLLADFQFVHWPLAQLNHSLEGAMATGDSQHRVISDQQQVIVDIHYQGNTVQFDHRQRGYQLTIEILDKWSI